ncbi:MAG: redox-regulated ATPase YchF [SAR324 cluster bacterium]|uniref:Redox-regulated ATPase YchF n=1 Tax=SAR324 cluster bacterium TaxID=2024889 RepID=A0A7X9FNW7_9DELT|nr:redox-regulated ATPase YchF [SAR324 cluster bacterium]
MKAAFVGFMQSGKSTILSAVSGKAAAPSGTNHIDEAVVSVPDERIDWLTSLYKPKKTIYASIDCMDLPGISLSDETGRIAARRLFTQARSADMFVLVVRAFEDPSIPAYRASVDPKRDVTELLSEFLLADLELASTRVEKLKLQIQKGGKTLDKDKQELEILRKFQDALENERPARTVEISEQEDEIIRSLGFLTLRPLMIAVNVGEGDLDNDFGIPHIVDRSVPVAILSAKIEQELSTLDAESRKEFMTELGLSQSAVSKFVNSCYEAMGFISFLTVGPDEVRAWPIRKGLSALEAAGKIHSDIKRGFIRAETISYSDLKELGSEKAVKAAGKARLEGKTYIMQDGDIVHFRFNV